MTAMFMHYSLIIGGALLAFCSPFRNLVRRFVFQPGQGPSREDAAKDYLEFRGVATPDVQPASGKRAQNALCRAWYQGGMYQRKWPLLKYRIRQLTQTHMGTVTAVCLSQGVLTLLEDDIGLSGGIYTPACLGQVYIDRLNEYGFKIETKIVED